jgi:hypothetical protein
MKPNRAKLLVLPACIVGALAASGTALATPPADTPVPLPMPQVAVEVGSSAVLAGNRVVVEVPVTVSCWVPNSTGAGVSVTITQAVGDRIANGYGNLPEELPCDGEAHEATVSVIANSGGAPFRVGKAAVQANVYACEAGTVEPMNCAFVTTPPQDLFIWRNH